jgi:DNA helicase-2/ATP-dependent DNA helicase PcrA
MGLSLVSVLMPAYNAERYLAQAIDSILNQTYTNFELIIFDDGSSDGTRKIIESYDDSRIVKLLSDRNFGVVKARNEMIDRAKGKYIALMDADDIADTTRLQKQVLVLEAGECDICGSAQWILNQATGKITKSKDKHTDADLRSLLAVYCTLCNSTVVGKSEIFKLFKYDTSMGTSEDYLLWVRIAAAGYIFKALRERLITYRVHSNQVTAINFNQFKDSTVIVLRRYLELLGLSKNLIAALPENKALQNLPVIACYNDPQEEMMAIAEQINQLILQGSEPKEIAVLYKENKYGEEIAHFLQQKNIPIYSKRTANLFDQVLIQQIIKILDYLACEWDQPNEGANLLFEILHFKWWHISPITIAVLTTEANQLKYSSPDKSYRQILIEKTQDAQTNLFEQGGIAAVGKAMSVLEDLMSQIPNVTLLNLLEQILQKTNIIQEVLTGVDKNYELSIVSHFFDFIKEETHRHPSLHLTSLVEMLKLMRREAIRLPLPITTGNEAGVNLLTAHGSKGLEFKYVFLAGTNAHYWEKKRSTANAGYTLPDTVLSSLEHANDKEELRRLFYVAITRAKQNLTISYSQYKSDGKEAEPSQFIIEVIEGKEAIIQKIELPSEVKATYTLLRLQSAPMPEIQQLEDDFITPKLEKFSMNVTALNNYLKCPLHFYYNSLIRVPSGKSEATTFGSAVHDALNKLFKKMQEANNVFPDIQTLVQDFNYYMNRHREAFTNQEFKDRKELGETVLIKYYDRYVNEWNKVVTTEYRINNVVVKDIPLKGAIDKIEFNGKQVVVIDYKTGNIENAREKLQGPNDKNPLGGDYWRQAVFYKILLNHHPKNWEVVSAEFDFVEPNKKKLFEKIAISISDADLTTVSQQIQMVWEKIQNKDFYTGCGKEDCHWCNFVKTNQLTVALHEIKQESETEEA